MTQWAAVSMYLLPMMVPPQIWPPSKRTEATYWKLSLDVSAPPQIRDVGWAEQVVLRAHRPIKMYVKRADTIAFMCQLKMLPNDASNRWRLYKFYSLIYCPIQKWKIRVPIRSGQYFIVWVQDYFIAKRPTNQPTIQPSDSNSSKPRLKLFLIDRVLDCFLYVFFYFLLAILSYRLQNE